MRQIGFIGDFLPFGKYESKLKENFLIKKYPSPKNNQELFSYAKDLETIVTHEKFDREILSKLPRLKLLISWSTGLDNIDTIAAKESGIEVRNIPDYCSQSVAEYVFGLILALIRKIPQSNFSVKEFKWDCLPFQGIELKNKVIGIVGYGRIGKRVAKIAKGFGMKILFVRKTQTALKGQVKLSFLLKNSDFVVICASFNSTSLNLINKANLSLMKKEAFLINISRGSLIDEEALISLLNKDLIAGAALDVIRGEPRVSEDILNAKNILITPHNAWNTKDSLELGAKQIYQIILNFFQLDKDV